jgi:threonyl-tRNA synthetase
MKILQLDVDNITYLPVKPEAKLYDDVKKEEVSLDDILVLLISIEKGDTIVMADKAMEDTKNFLEKLKRKKLLIYPYAHLSNNLAAPEDALSIINRMVKSAPVGVETFRGPFGWNKKLSLDIKGHPLAEQSRSYYPTEQEEKTYKKVKPVSVNTSIVRKSSWAGLPETDHRTIGEKLDLYSFQEVSPSMVYWHPNGSVILRKLTEFIREKEEEYGYKEIGTPILANTALWHVSGHIEHYKDNMFVFDSDIGEMGLKPMNCPSSILIYKSKKWSYRDLPFRTAIFDKLYRKEVSGSLTGLFRVQEMTQDDGHIFLREDQLEEEITNLLHMVKEVYATFGMRFLANLSTMPDNHLGDEALWVKATNTLKKALEKNNMDYKIKDKEGAFYGPKIDFDVFDALGRSWQLSTIQIDYQQPLRFKLEYTDEAGREETPIIVHRAILGTLERFIAVLVEHYQGKFPTWLAPTQVKVISISEQTNAYAEKIYKEIKKNKIRVEFDAGDKTMENKLREAILQKIPYMIILGKKEEAAGTVTVRCMGGAQKFGVKLEEFLGNIEKEVKNRDGKLMY